MDDFQEGDYVKYGPPGGEGTVIYGQVDAPLPGQALNLQRVVELAAFGLWGHGFSPGIRFVDNKRLTKVSLSDPLNEIWPTVGDLVVGTVKFLSYAWDGSHHSVPLASTR